MEFAAMLADVVTMGCISLSTIIQQFYTLLHLKFVMVFAYL